MSAKLAGPECVFLMRKQKRGLSAGGSALTRERSEAAQREGPICFQRKALAAAAAAGGRGGGLWGSPRLWLPYAERVPSVRKWQPWIPGRKRGSEGPGGAASRDLPCLSAEEGPAPSPGRMAGALPGNLGR